MTTTRRHVGKTLTAMTLALATLGYATLATSQETIKVGLLHSLSGTMAISETVLKGVTLMAIEEINAKGGVLGNKLEPVVVDPASNWPLFADLGVSCAPRLAREIALRTSLLIGPR